MSSQALKCFVKKNDLHKRFSGVKCDRTTDLYSPKVSSFMGRASESSGPSSLSFTAKQIIGFRYQRDHKRAPLAATASDIDNDFLSGQRVEHQIKKKKKKNQRREADLRAVCLFMWLLWL